jgi:hypothetical protein
MVAGSVVVVASSVVLVMVTAVEVDSAVVVDPPRVLTASPRS